MDQTGCISQTTTIMKLILNKTKNHYERYTLINESMGSYGEKENHVNHKYSIANGVCIGNGYQGYCAVSYFLTFDYVPQECKDKIIDICKKENLLYK